MIAKVNSSKSISATLDYDCNAEKDGRILLSSGIDPSLPAGETAHLLELCHNPKFKVQALTIVLSHSREDSKKLTLDDEVRCLKAFMKDLQEHEGVNLDAAPWVAFRHDNTDCTHTHIAIMATCYDGSRFKDSFLGAKACRAAARVSMAIGLDAAPKAAARVEATKDQVKQVEPTPLVDQETQKKTKKWFNRKAAIAAAKQRHEQERIEQERIERQKQEERAAAQKQEDSHKRDRGGKADAPEQSRGIRR